MIDHLASRIVAAVVALTVNALPGAIAPAQARPQDPSPVLAFPGAEGAGRHALGGRGGRVLRVTTLADSGPGSLREAVEAPGPRTIVFDIGGTIRLATPLRIRQPRITLAGQTAPGGGITLRDQPLIVSADDVIVRYVRSRLGDESGVEADAISIERGRRIILDHVSASWSVDETLSAGSRYDPPERGLYDVTVQWSIIAESLNASGHAKGDHGYGTLARASHGARLSFRNNLWASHRARMPRPGNYLTLDIDPVGGRFDFVNNVFFNWGGGRAGYNADREPATISTYAFIANAYRTGPDSTGGVIFEEESAVARAWFDANALDGALPSDPWSLVEGDDRPDYRLTDRPTWVEAPARTAAEAEVQVLAHAGASRSRDAVDARIVAGVVSGTGRIIDSQAQVGGWPDLDTGQPWLDGDRDGMPDDWEEAMGHDPARDDGAADADGDGYTNLEEWLTALADGTSR